jgi:hypothetical protein
MHAPNSANLLPCDSGCAGQSQRLRGSLRYNTTSTAHAHRSRARLTAAFNGTKPVCSLGAPAAAAVHRVLPHAVPCWSKDAPQQPQAAAVLQHMHQPGKEAPQAPRCLLPPHHHKVCCTHSSSRAHRAKQCIRPGPANWAVCCCLVVSMEHTLALRLFASCCSHWHSPCGQGAPCRAPHPACPPYPPGTATGWVCCQQPAPFRVADQTWRAFKAGHLHLGKQVHQQAPAQAYTLKRCVLREMSPGRWTGPQCGAPLQCLRPCVGCCTRTTTTLGHTMSTRAQLPPGKPAGTPMYGLPNIY